jgi:HEAT repeat protein
MGLFGPPDVRKLKAKHDVHSLIKALSYEKDERIRVQAARALGELKDVRTVKPLITALKDNSEVVRRTACEELGKLGPLIRDPALRASIVPPLIALLNDEGPTIKDAAKALGAIGDARAVEPLIAALKNVYYHNTASNALAKIGTPAVEPLIAALNNDNIAVRNGAAEALGEIGDVRAVEPLISAFATCKPGQHHDTALALGKFHDARSDAVLIAFLSTYVFEDLNGQIRPDNHIYYDLKQLGWGPRSDAGITLLVENNDWDQCLRIGAPAVERLIALFTDNNYEQVRGQIARTLGRIGDDRAVEPLIADIESDNPHDRSSAIGALGLIGDARAVEPLIKVFYQGSAAEREAAARALGNLGAHLKDATIRIRVVDFLIASIKENWDVGRGIVEALGQIGDVRAVEPLIALLQDKNEKFRNIAAETLGKIGDLRAVGPLLTALKDTQRSAAIALVSIYKAGRLDETNKKIILDHRIDITKLHTDGYHHIDTGCGSIESSSHNDIVNLDFPL